ncbi:28S ribosomal protein S35, mitochondrial-like [Mizuhopecten yessoensis]|uniref:28S ribosomal protein S35, mitochondrial n=1 Tax=Mizuhopecten yessoensis TaxID=6573 RepID=A0A210Q5F6_MIZYE|nr:28S ribosomal protein S35, mitochondrial-like [Mizuhopecten yessoensis]OWF43919.1 28S ribosomal protein S35, mitochondrial [Mizuhopecten yessoensis]
MATVIGTGLKGMGCMRAASIVGHRQSTLHVQKLTRCCSTENTQEPDILDKTKLLKSDRMKKKTGDDEFIPFVIRGKEPQSIDRHFKKWTVFKDMKHPDRHNVMTTEQDWTKVWPTSGVFRWSSVPLALRQGVIRNETENEGIIPDKEGNTELIKVPNFLHLTPPHVWKHCQALKKFCTPWPEGLDSKEDCRLHFPVEVVTSDYCFAGPSIRDPRSRVVTVKVKLSDLELDEHARHKLLKLVGDRYDKDNDMLIFKTDKCPTKQQNRDYAIFLLTAVYLEAWKKMPWEDDIEGDDFLDYQWNLSKAKDRTVLNLMSMAEGDQNSVYHNEEENEILEKEEVKNYAKAISKIYDDEESIENLNDLKQSALNMLQLRTS